MPPCLCHVCLCRLPVVYAICLLLHEAFAIVASYLRHHVVCLFLPSDDFAVNAHVLPLYDYYARLADDAAAVIAVARFTLTPPCRRHAAVAAFATAALLCHTPTISGNATNHFTRMIPRTACRHMAATARLFCSASRARCSCLIASPCLHASHAVTQAQWRPACHIAFRTVFLAQPSQRARSGTVCDVARRWQCRLLAI